MNIKSKRGVISTREYQWLKTFPNLTEEEQHKVAEYEETNKPRVFKKPESKPSPKPQDKVEITKGLLWRGFKKFYELFKAMGITKDLGEKVEVWKYKKHNEAERIATMLKSKLKN